MAPATRSSSNASTGAPDDASDGRDPIAVIGAGCRLPGGIHSPAGFWRFIDEGRSAVQPLPEDRWAAYRGVGPATDRVLDRTTRWAGLVEDVAGFDAAFFEISPREAEMMDPQQRMTLEVAWESLEHAGIVPARLAGSRTGVFVGVWSDDYGRRVLEDLPSISAWSGVGTAIGTLAARVSHALDLRGPSVALDTACSSSLMAVHLACQSLRAGETALALAGGVNLILSPALTVNFDEAGAMARDGKCKAFDASADGYVRSDGCGMVVLKRLADARRDGDRVLALIRGSAANQDGRSPGIMQPNPDAQREMIRLACADAAVPPATVDYVEAHGTGTRIGDPLEARGIGLVLRDGRPADRPCLLGSVKTNLGHTESAAGVTGLIKAVLCLANRRIPASLNFSAPNPDIDFEDLGLRVAAEASPWPRHGHPRRAGVSSFGFGGQNVHVVLEEAPEDQALDGLAAEPQPADGEAAQGARPGVYVLSGRSPQARSDGASRLADWLERDGATVALCDVGSTLAHRRSHFEHRLAVIAGGRGELVAALRGFARGEESETVSGSTPAEPGEVVWVFPGQGSQWSGMGRELLSAEPAFAAAIAELEPLFLAEAGFSLREALLSGEVTEGIDRIQPVLFAMQVALARVWESHGVRPAAVLGHSMGEVAAAVVAGVLAPADGVAVICRRSRLMRTVAGNGLMAVVELPQDEVRRQLADVPEVSVAVHASPRSTVISGAAERVAALVERWRGEELLARLIKVDVASHSSQVDPLLPELGRQLRALSPGAPRVAFYSTVLDDPRIAPSFDAGYWVDNLRRPVRFADAVAAAAADGLRVFVEISPHPALTYAVGDNLDAAAAEDAVVLSTLRRDEPEAAAFLRQLTRAYCHGVQIDLDGLHPGGALADVPATAWQHERYWVEGSGDRARGVRGHDPQSGTLLGSRLSTRPGAPLDLWQTRLSEPGEAESAGGALLVNTLLAAARPRSDGADLRDVELGAAPSTGAPLDIQVLAEGGRLRVLARGDSADGRWFTWASAIAENGDETTGDGAAEGALLLTEDISAPAQAQGSDAVLAALLAAALDLPVRLLGRGPEARPVHIARVQVGADVPRQAVAHVRLHAADSRANAADTVHIDVLDHAGSTVLHLSSVHYESVAEAAPVAVERIAHSVGWRPLGEAEAPGRKPRTVTLVGPPTQLASQLAAMLEAAGTGCARVDGPDALAGAQGGSGAGTTVVVLPPEPRDGTTAAASAAACKLLADTVRTLADRPSSHPPSLWCLTEGVRQSIGLEALAQAPLWGLARVTAGEHPELWGGLVDLDAEQPAPLRAEAAARLLTGDFGDLRADEDVLAFDGSRLLVRRLKPIEPPVGGRSGSAPTPRADASYLVTGGLGALGLLTARRLADWGARRLVLAGRRPLIPRCAWATASDPLDVRAIAGIRALEAAGVTVRTVALDIADFAQAQACLDPDSLGLPPIRGVVHAAGVIRTQPVTALDPQVSAAVLRPKVQGALTLHALFPPGSVDLFTLFSSVGAFADIPGGADYAAANAFLDALALHRRAQGCAAMSIAWGAWSGHGMAAAGGAVLDRELSARGFESVRADDAFAAWEYAAQQGAAHVAVTALASGPRRPARLPAILQDLDLDASPTADGARAPAAAVSDGAAPDWAAMSPAERRARLLRELRTIAASEMKLSAAAMDPRRPLKQYGLESIMALGIRRRLEALTALRLPASLVWNRPSLNALADDLSERLASAFGDDASEHSDQESDPESDTERHADTDTETQAPVGVSALDGLLEEFEDELAADHA